ncbi:MAG: hypothetical protein A2W03_16025 [Candidatus Aminicenantes bacterium RBG_16_63_16]|nr:MAG: hypothetical protein A2W03_16025 [Candidatus Aminicenantes bacterium RBG_16_63_16]
MTNRTWSRREFLKTAAVTPLAAAIGPATRGMAPAQSGAKTRVVLIRDRNALDAAGVRNPAVIQKMLDEAVCALLGEKDPVAAWKTLIRPSDIVGIKTNVWRPIDTGEAVEQALKRRIMDAGVTEDRIGLDDRGVLRNPIFQKATALVNARPARTHYWSGMGSCIKNYIMFVPQPWAYHGDACADLARIWSLPPVMDKTRLNVLVMLTPLFHSVGPHNFSRDYVWPYSGILVGRDPVAVDATGFRILQAKRLQHFGEDRPLETSAHHIALADTRHHLGVSDPGRIDLVRLGWQEDIVI